MEPTLTKNYDFFRVYLVQNPDPVFQLHFMYIFKYSQSSLYGLMSFDCERKQSSQVSQMYISWGVTDQR
jgi:hypothetical protein